MLFGFRCPPLIAVVTFFGIAQSAQAQETPKRLPIEDLTYAGAFRLESARGPGDDRIGNGGGGQGGGFGYDETTKQLWIVGRTKFHNYHIYDSSKFSATEGPISSIDYIAPRLRTASPIGGTGAGDRIGPTAFYDGTAMMSVYTYYNTSGRSYPQLYVFDPTPGTDKSVHGPYLAKGLRPQKTSGLAGVVPRSLRWLFPEGFHVFFGGGGHLPGTAFSDNGLGIHLIKVPNIDSLPPPNSKLDVISLIAHPHPKHKASEFKNCDAHRGAAFIHIDDKAALVTANRMSSTVFYGKIKDAKAAGIKVCGSGKGYHCGPYTSELRFYDVEDLVRSANGQIDPWEVEPFHVWDITDKLYSDCDKIVTGLAYDSSTRQLLAIEPKVDYLSSQFAGVPVIHVFQVKDQSGD